MDSVQILDHYRLSLVHSRDGIQALACLLRSGPKRSADLAPILSIALPETKRILNWLYRAALVRRTDPDLWLVSPLGEQVLEGLCVLDLATADLAESLATTEADRGFLYTWLRRPTRGRDSRACLSLLRSFHQMQAADDGWYSGNPANRAPLLYAIVIAGHAWAEHAVIEDVWNALEHESAPRLLVEEGPQPTTSSSNESIAAAWQAGMRRYRDSNRLLLLIPQEWPASTDQETVELTWLRAIDAAMRGSADQGLRTSCNVWAPSDAAAFWEFMFEQRFVEQRTRALCARQGWRDQPSMTHELRAELVKRLLRAIGGPAAEGPREPDDAGVTRSPNEYYDLTLRLHRATDRIVLEGSGVVPEQLREALGDAVTRLSVALREAPQGRKPGGEDPSKGQLPEV